MRPLDLHAPPQFVLSFDFDGTLRHPADSPPVNLAFFELIRGLRDERHVAWGINTGRSMAHVIEVGALDRGDRVPGVDGAADHDPGVETRTMYQRLEHGLAPWSAYLVVPVFGFANAGVSLAGMGPEALVAALPLAVAAGLVVGKQLGIFTVVWIADKTGFAIDGGPRSTTQRSR